MKIAARARAVPVLAALASAAVLAGCSDEPGDALPPPTTADQPSSAAPPPTEPTEPTVTGGGPETGGLTAAEVCELLTVAEAKQILNDKAGASFDLVEANPATAGRANCSYDNPDEFIPNLTLETFDKVPGTMGTKVTVAGRKGYQYGGGTLCGLGIVVDAKVALTVIAQGSADKDLCAAVREAAETALERLEG